MADYPMKIWLALGRCVAFTENDKRIFRIWPDHEQYTKNKSVDLIPKFIQAIDLNAARYQAHKFVDDMFNSFVKNDEHSTVYAKPKPPEAEPLSEQLDSLTIDSGGGKASVKSEEPKIETDISKISTNNNDLLDLNSLLS